MFGFIKKLQKSNQPNRKLTTFVHILNSDITYHSAPKTAKISPPMISEKFSIFSRVEKGAHTLPRCFSIIHEKLLMKTIK